MCQVVGVTTVIRGFAAWALRIDKLATSAVVQRTASLQHGCSRPWWLGTRAGVESLRQLERLQKSNNMQQCGICSVLSDVFRRIMCIGGSRRGSGDSYYQELDDEDVSNRRLIRNQQPRL